MVSFLNSELILSIVQMAEAQAKVYTEFCKHFPDDKHEARLQTEIFMKTMYASGSNSKSDKVE